MKDGEPTTINRNATQTTSTFAILASATSPATSLPTPVPSPPPKPPSLSKGAIAGIAVGAVGWVVILAIALYAFILRRKRRRQRGAETFDTAPQPAFGHRPPSAEMKEKASIDQHPARGDSEKGDLPMYPHPPERSGTLRSELSADAPPAELAGEDRTVPAKISPAAELVGCTPTYRELE